MSQAKPEALRPSGNWRCLMPDRLTVWRLFSADLEPLGLTADAQFRETPSNIVVRSSTGGIATRYEVSREHLTEANIVLGQVLQCGAVRWRSVYGKLVEENREGAPPFAQICLALLLAERLALRIPRGATAEGAEWTPILRACAQELRDYIELNMQVCRHIQGCKALVFLPWLERVVHDAKAAGAGTSAEELAAYAMATGSNIDWKALSLKAPDPADVEYFKKHYLAGVVVGNLEGRKLVREIIARFTPAPPVQAPEGPVPAKVVAICERDRARRLQILNRLAQ